MPTEDFWKSDLIIVTWISVNLEYNESYSDLLRSNHRMTFKLYHTYHTTPEFNANPLRNLHTDLTNDNTAVTHNPQHKSTPNSHSGSMTSHSPHPLPVSFRRGPCPSQLRTKLLSEPEDNSIRPAVNSLSFHDKFIADRRVRERRLAPQSHQRRPDCPFPIDLRVRYRERRCDRVSIIVRRRAEFRRPIALSYGAQRS